MRGTIFLAGASGGVGRCLAPLLVAEHWRFVGTIRTEPRGSYNDFAGRNRCGF